MKEVESIDDKEEKIAKEVATAIISGKLVMLVRPKSCGKNISIVV